MGESTPICRCRVLYLGSAVPRQSKDGLQGIQEPLKSLYPPEGAVGAKGIDSWLSVWSNGILLENVDEHRKQVTRFFPIESLHYCAAVRQVLIPERGNTNTEPKFLPLDSPFARVPKALYPPIFAAILRRTTGIKVLECHVFICKREAAANALVRCCFHAYADNSYAKQLEGGNLANSYGDLSNKNKTTIDVVNSWKFGTESNTNIDSLEKNSNSHHLSLFNINNIEQDSNVTPARYAAAKSLYASSIDLDVADDPEGSIYDGEENHKVWSGSHDQIDSVECENPYETFSGGVSTLEKPVRTRQISTPIHIAPPPLKDEINKKKEKKPLKYSYSQSLSGTLIRPKPVHMNISHRSIINSPSGTVLYNPNQALRQCHTFNYRPIFSNGTVAKQMHPELVSLGAPLPVSVMISPQYATLQPNRTVKKKRQDKANNAFVGMFVPPPIKSQPIFPEPRQLVTFNKKLIQSAGTGLDDCVDSDTESPSGTGIYKRKGHLNERAFSYSIRQEHRSRSYGSLANLQFNLPDIKKEREITQAMAGLNLNNENITSYGNRQDTNSLPQYGLHRNFEHSKK